ncbi:MAG TPA: UDP-N-acetylglucosamine--N-acetylmuramyl-(pentapeptide) pyrophosphoryl-undecaprenol N-acetylglucosamine transferase [Phycisphaerales bacterium]|nr:UDP-N-acetylglucosamine--N-acetylmuramyl-(pentapeptide) pyrophosphoryl-undecaprenol N-acetylglucosamine transferase [Phycisphaerales bacterium]
MTEHRPGESAAAHGPLYIFAGGGTGGHIYPALAVAEALERMTPGARMRFFCSDRAIDSRILSRTSYEFVPLAVRGLSMRPDRLARFAVRQCREYHRVRAMLRSALPVAVLGTGGFASAPVVLAAHRLGLPVGLLNVDAVVGRANRFLARFADCIFVQFKETAVQFRGAVDRMQTVGCPLRAAFNRADPDRAIRRLGLSVSKKTLLITGASSGATSINRAVERILPRLGQFAADWQIVHLTGLVDHERCRRAYENAPLAHVLMDYNDDMPDLYATADLLVGRAGAVSVAEYAAAGVPAICLPYPYHRDQHQRRNAEPLVAAGAAVIVEDRPDNPEQTAEQLYVQLCGLMGDAARREGMAQAARRLVRTDAAEAIARWLVDH